MTWRAHIDDGKPYDLSVRLHVFRQHSDGRIDVLMPDASVVRVEEGTKVPDDAGLAIPRDSLEAIAEVFHPYAVGQAELRGEMRAIKEALRMESARVEKIINKALGA